MNNDIFHKLSKKNLFWIFLIIFSFVFFTFDIKIVSAGVCDDYNAGDPCYRDCYQWNNYYYVQESNHIQRTSYVDRWSANECVRATSPVDYGFGEIMRIAQGPGDVQDGYGQYFECQSHWCYYGLYRRKCFGNWYDSFSYQCDGDMRQRKKVRSKYYSPCSGSTSYWFDVPCPSGTVCRNDDECWPKIWTRFATSSNPWHSEYNLYDLDDNSISSQNSWVACSKTSHHCAFIQTPGGSPTCYGLGAIIPQTTYGGNKKIKCVYQPSVGQGVWLDVDGANGYFCSPASYIVETSGETTSHGGYFNGLSDGIECCGDDNYEKVVSRVSRYSSGDGLFLSGSSASDRVCCSHSTDCVYNNKCYINAVADVTGDSRNDGVCYQNKWTDCDIDVNHCQNYCGYEFIKSGEFNIAGMWGEYDSGTKVSAECCGDEAPETTVSCKKTANTNWNCAGKTSCCDIGTDCIDPGDGECITHNQPDEIDLTTQQDKYSYCQSTGQWEDCDYEINNCGDAICGDSAGVTCGENLLECNYLETECCGDDTDENYDKCLKEATIKWDCQDTYSCCDQETDCVDPGDNKCHTRDDVVDVVNSEVDDISICKKRGIKSAWFDCDDNVLACSTLSGTCANNEKMMCGEDFDDCFYGEMECCGDDYMDTHDVCSKESNIFWDCQSAESCCDNADDCVDGGDNKCYDSDTPQDVFADTLDDKAYCQLTASGGEWADCDQNIAQCTEAICGDINGIKCGATFGECVYGQTMCCGDDNPEKVNFCQQTSEVDWSCNTNNICCDASTDCIDPGDDTCKDVGFAYNLINNNQIDSKSFCFNTGTSGEWADCDDHVTDCGSDVCAEGSPVTCGEDFDDCVTGESECCGDDWQENFNECIQGAETFWSCGETVSCCNNPTDCVDTDNSCLEANSVYDVEYSEADNFAYCQESVTGSSWIDCDIKTSECGTDVCGNGNGVTCGEDLAECSYGETECCGDDHDEYFETCTKHDNIAWECTNTEACCDITTDCVDPGDNTCYDANSPHNISTAINYDTISYCLYNGDHGQWKDCDSEPQRCGDAVCGDKNGVYSGELNAHGEFGGMNSTETQCCGDDASEYYLSFKVKNTGSDIEEEESVGKVDDETDVACCDNPTDCVFDGVCYAINEPADIDGDGVVGEFCDINNKWNDCDSSAEACNHPKCLELSWRHGGEMRRFGEYENGTGSEVGECCEDDEGEFFIDAGIGVDRCCNNEEDCVDLHGICRDEYPKEVTCFDEIDNDCDGFADCADPDCICGTEGPEGQICNGIQGGFLGADYVDKNGFSGSSRYHYCSAVDDINPRCLTEQDSRYSKDNIIKCGNSETETFGVCNTYDTIPEDGLECAYLGVSNFHLDVAGWRCVEEEYLYGETMELNISYDTNITLDSWDFLVECVVSTENGTFYENRWITSPQGSHQKFQIQFPLVDLAFNAPLISGRKINANVKCYAYTDFWAESGWRVSPILDKNFMVKATCDNECLIEDEFYTHEAMKSDLPCYYCNVSKNQFGWSAKSDGQRCVAQLSARPDLCDKTSGCEGLCCDTTCNTLFSTGLAIEPEHTDPDENSAFWLDAACLQSRKSGFFACEGSELKCDNSLCIDEDKYDDNHNLDSDPYMEYIDNEILCDEHEDCASDDPTYTCDLSSCVCRRMARCLINGEDYYAGETNPTNPCQICDISVATTEWTNLPTGTMCGPWQCSSNSEVYQEDGGKFGVIGSCAFSPLVNDIACVDVFDSMCADSDIEDFGNGTQKVACSAQCDSIYDKDGNDKCYCPTSKNGKCLDVCEWRPPCEGIRILGIDFHCGVEDGVCPTKFKDPSLRAPKCSDHIGNECYDPDC